MGVHVCVRVICMHTINESFEAFAGNEDRALVCDRRCL